jgi:hypothetical protein
MHVIVSCNNNPRYKVYWPFVFKSWKNVFPDCLITLYYVSSTFEPSEFQYTQHIKWIPLSVSEEQYSVLIAQCIRLLVPTLIRSNLNQQIITADIDLIPMGRAQEFFSQQTQKPITIYRPLIKAHSMVAVSYVGMTNEYWRKCFPSIYTFRDMIDIILNVWKQTFTKYAWFTDQLVLYQTLIRNPEIAKLCHICDDSYFKRLDKHELKDVDPYLYSDCHLPKLDESNKSILNSIIDKLQNKQITT